LGDGTLDPAFGEEGLVFDGWGASKENSTVDIAIDGHGRIIVAGTAAGQTSSSVGLAAYRSDGSADPSLGGTGKVVIGTFEGQVTTMEIDAEGRIVVGASTRSDPLPLFRFLADGTPDPSFGSNGAVAVGLPGYGFYGGVAGLAIDSQGRLVIASTGTTGSPSNPDFFVARLLPGGALDLGFGGDGAALTTFNDTDGQDGDYAEDVALVGGLRPIVVGETSGGRALGFGEPTRSSFAIARYQGTGPPPECPPTSQATIVGTDAAQTINGTAGPDVIMALGGNDVVYGQGGNDVICGGAGNDRLNGGAGNDTLLGEADNDALAGDGGADTLVGGPGTDTYPFAGSGDLTYP